MLIPKSDVYPDPYYYALSEVLTIELSGYHGRINDTDLWDCINNAMRDVELKVTTGQEATLMTQIRYFWSAGDVELYLTPGPHLTWRRWSQVPLGLRIFVRRNEHKGTQFVVLENGEWPMGYGQLIAASETTPAATNAFPDPYHKRYSDGLTIEFHGYRGQIPAMAMEDCLDDAADEVVRHLQGLSDPMTMTAPSFTYSRGGVTLSLVPTTHLLWHTWAFIPIFIKKFVTENGLRGTQFTLSWEGIGPLGHGELVHTLDSVSTASGLAVS